jgi:hypothetical protein
MRLTQMKTISRRTGDHIGFFIVSAILGCFECRLQNTLFRHAVRATEHLDIHSLHPQDLAEF